MLSEDPIIKIHDYAINPNKQGVIDVVRAAFTGSGENSRLERFRR